MKNFLSLGAGVQSSTLALMAARGEITPMPDAAIFADTQAEPESVYRWLDWLTTQLPFPVMRVTAGNLTQDLLEIKYRKKDGLPYIKPMLPFYVRNLDGKKGMLPNRVCTYKYKLEILQKTARRLAAVKRGEKNPVVSMWIGISRDEAHRMKPSRERWIENRWPLIEAEMSRNDCLRWMREQGYPTPPRSACVYCPFHSKAEWQRLKSEEPAEFQRATEFERQFQALALQCKNIRGTLFLHPSLQPLDTVDFVKSNQSELWGNECEGICGV